MKLTILSNDVDLINKLKENEIFTEVNQGISFEEGNTDILIISDEIVKYTDLSTTTFGNAEHVFYMLSSTYSENNTSIEKSVRAICDSRDIVLIPPRLVNEQIADLIVSKIKPTIEKLSNVITFFSTNANVGTTSTCLSVASALTHYSKAKIGVLLLNAWDCGTDQLDYKKAYLDDIKPRLSGQSIENEQEFFSMFQMLERDRLYILGGNKSTKMERLFTKEEIHYLISMAKETFDIVLIDSGSHFDNANMVQALSESNLKILVFNQQPKSIKKFDRVFNELLYQIGFQKTDFLMVINQYINKSHYPTAKEIFNNVGVPILTTVESTQFGIESELEQRILFTYDDANYNDSILLIVKSIASSTGIEIEHLERKKKKVLGLF